MAGLQVELCSSVYIDKEKITLQRFQYKTPFACFFPFSSSCCLCLHNGRIFVFYNNRWSDWIDQVSQPCSEMFVSLFASMSPVHLLSSLMVPSHCKHFIQFSSFFCGMWHVYEQLHKTMPRESGSSQCKKAWHVSVDVFLCCAWTNLRYWRHSA